MNRRCCCRLKLREEGEPPACLNTQIPNLPQHPGPQKLTYQACDIVLFSDAVANGDAIHDQESELSDAPGREKPLHSQSPAERGEEPAPQAQTLVLT